MTKKNCDFAKRALRFAEGSDFRRILLELVQHTSDPEVVHLAKQFALKHPNAPDSFSLMCEVSRSDPGTAVPWISEWIKTAMLGEVVTGLSYIVAVAPTPEYVDMARKQLAEIAKGNLPYYDWNLAQLLCVLIKADPRAEELDQAAQLLKASPEQHHPRLRKLSSLLNRTRSVEE